MVLFFLFLLPVYLYLGFRLGEHWIHWIILGSLFVSIMSFPLKKFFRYQLHLIHAGMGILTYLFVFTVLRDLIWLFTSILYPIFYILLLTAFCNVLGLFNAMTGPRIKNISVRIHNLSPKLHGFKIIQISDLHVGATIRKPYVEKVVKKVNNLQADIIALTGDIGDGHVQHYREDIAPIRGMKSRYGSFFSPGNHEYYWGVNEWLGVMNNLGVINLVNRGKIIKHNGENILIAGIPDPVAKEKPDLLGIQDSEPGETSQLKILLSHRPGIAWEASKHGFDLQLSGHTHGGQFFPWTLVVKMVHKISLGLHQIGNMWIYVSPGTGSWGPPLRLGTYSEITLLTLINEQISHSLHEK